MDIVSMVKSGNIDMVKALNDIEDLVKAVPQALKDCGMFGFFVVGPLADDTTC